MRILFLDLFRVAVQLYGANAFFDWGIVITHRSLNSEVLEHGVDVRLLLTIHQFSFTLFESFLAVFEFEILANL